MHSNPKQSKFRPKWILILLTAFILGLCLVSRAKTFAFTHASKGQQSTQEAILPTYEKSVIEKNDPQALAKIGQNLLRKYMPLFAIPNFKRASELDPDFRDAAYGWAYSIALSRQNNLSQDDLDQITTALDKVEAVDPHYIPALQLRKQVAELEGKSDIVSAMNQRIELLQ